MKVLAPAYEIELNGLNLERQDLLSQSDAFFKITARPHGTARCVTVYKSEIIKDNKSPKWKPFQLNIGDFGGHVDAEFVVDVFDIDPNGTTTLIGSVSSTFREWTFGPFQQALYREFVKASLKLVSPPPSELILTFLCSDSSKSRGSLNLVRITPLPTWVEKRFPSAFKLITKANRLERMNAAGTGKSDPYFEIVAFPTATTRDTTPGSPQDRPITLYRSPVVKDTLNPSWPEFYLTVDMLGSLDADFQICVYDEDDTGDNKLIGKNQCTLRELSWGPTLLPLINEDKAIGASKFVPTFHPFYF